MEMGADSRVARPDAIWNGLKGRRWGWRGSLFDTAIGGARRLTLRPDCDALDGIAMRGRLL
jgi:hypothetical protein